MALLGLLQDTWLLQNSAHRSTGEFFYTSCGIYGLPGNGNSLTTPFPSPPKAQRVLASLEIAMKPDGQQKKHNSTTNVGRSGWAG